MIKKIVAFLAFTLLSASAFLQAQDEFFIMGSGQINLKSSSGSTGKITYRNEKGYDEKALRKINQTYGGNYDDPLSRMSLRFLEVLSNIQSHFNDALIMQRSGFRSMRSNQGLRNQGKMAAQSSMHVEAAAIDFYLQGVNVLELKDYATQLPCCGVGYYQGRHIHLDTGPKRWWDQSNSGTDKKEPQENEKIIVLMSQDIFYGKQAIHFDFARVTNLPFGVKTKVQLEKWNKDQWTSTQSLPIALAETPASTQECLSVQSRKDIKQVSLQTSSLAAGRYRMKIDFCDKQWSKMPDQIYSDPFEVRTP